MTCLNPCFSGTYSQSQQNPNKGATLPSLNPCFSGTYSQRNASEWIEYPKRGLNPCFSGTYSQRTRMAVSRVRMRSLNPCFSGTYSQSYDVRSELFPLDVLILVLVEHTLRGNTLANLNQLLRS